MPDLRKHLRSVPPDDLTFTSAEGMALSNTNFRRRVWLPALAAVGLEGVHIHDLRHTGNVRVVTDLPGSGAVEGGAASGVPEGELHAPEGAGSGWVRR